MKVPANRIESLLQNISTSAIFSCLLHGPDYGVKNELSKRLIQAYLGINHYPEAIISMDSDSMPVDGTHVYDEAFNQGLFISKKVIKIQASQHHKLTPIIKNILQKKHDLNSLFIIILLSEKETNSEIIRLYQNLDDLAAIACYPDDERTTYDLVNAFFKKHSLQADEDVISHAASTLGGNRMLLMNELQKLSLYLEKNEKVTIEILEQVTGTVEEPTIDTCIDAICLKRPDVALNILPDILCQGSAQGIIFIRTLVSHLLKLRSVHRHIASGCQVAEAIKKEAIFFKRVGNFSKQISIWNFSSIDATMHKLLKLEVLFKHHPENIGRLMIYNAAADICMVAAM